MQDIIISGQAKNTQAINIFNKYVEKYPDDMFGNYMIAKANAAIDSTGTMGLAAPYYLKALEIGENTPDKSKIKDYQMGAYRFLIEYNYNVKKDQATALLYADKALALAPDDAQLLANKEFMQKNDPKAAPKKATQVDSKTKIKVKAKTK